MNNFKIGILLFFAIIHTNCREKENRSSIKLPNIIIILADDYGVGNIQKHYPDNKIPSPYLDKLVSEGMSFTDAHSSSAVCTPTRYGLLTGRYTWRTPLQEWVLGCYEPPLINPDRITLPEMLRAHNYSTACIGKWHLGWEWPGNQPNKRMEEKNVLDNYEWDYSKPLRGGPIDHGFDYYFGEDVINQPPYTYIENDRVVNLPTAQYKYDPTEGVAMPRNFDASPMAPDWQFNKVLPGNTNRCVEYIHSQSKSDNPFFLYFAMSSPHTPVVPTDKFAGKSGIAEIADFLMETDWSVGQILMAVEEAGISENTIIIFTADNGHPPTQWDKLIEHGHFPSGIFRGRKGTIWEGGHRVPFIVKWKSKIEAGSVSTQLLCLTDIYSTIYELVSGELPPFDSAEDSFSFLKTLFHNKESSLRDNIVNHSVNGEFAYRSGHWKIVYLMPEKTLELSRGKPVKIELYNLEKDISEITDVSEQYPEIVDRLTKELQTIVDRGTSRKGSVQHNDVLIKIDTIQEYRWSKDIIYENR
jgi:arylsulfatase A